MRPAHPTERAVGIAHYVSDADGIGGTIRAEPADFRVRELERTGFEPLDADPGSYAHVVLRATLENWDTNDFARALSNKLGISRERVDWAGTKDKRAITTQLFSIRGGDPDALTGVDLGGADIEVVGRAGRSLQFGDLAGNAFEITVRDADPDPVSATTDDLREFGGDDASDGSEDAETVGVPNYFGQQRFGSLRPVTHEVGLAVARGDWKGAVVAYLGHPDDAEPPSTREARGFVDDEVAAAGEADWAAVLDRFPNRLGFERSMLHRLVEDGASGPDDFRAALETVPTNLQRLFVNAAQSYVFNRILSARLDAGLPFDAAVAGDVVCFTGEESRDGLAVPDPSRDQRVTSARVETMNRHTSRGRAFVTAPLVGTETELAEGEPGEIERAVLADVGIEPADFDLPGEFHSTGTRRAILVRIGLAIEHDPLTFGFRLPKGSYATVLLREYCKTDPRDLG